MQQYWAVKWEDSYLTATEKRDRNGGYEYAVQWGDVSRAIAYASRGAAQRWINTLGRGELAEVTPEMCTDARWRENRRRRGVKSW